MKLQEYMDALFNIATKFRAEGDIRGAVEDSLENDGGIDEDYQWAITQVHQAIKENRGLLGILPEDPSKADREKVKETEIGKKELREHVAHVRLSLKRTVEGDQAMSSSRIEVLKTILQALSTELHVTDLGGIFEGEEKALGIQKKKPKEKRPDPVARFREADHNIDIMNARLHGAGKIK